jgi:hypothetical protein
MFTIIKIKEKGFTLVEVLVYAAGLIILLSAMVTLLFYMYGWYRSVTIGPRSDQVGTFLVTKIEGDIRGANSINLSQSVFGSATGAISVTSTINSISTTTYYALQNGHLINQINGGASSYVSPSEMTISAFTLNQITTSVSSAVRFEIDVAYLTKSGTTTNAYYGLAILRQSYQ